MKLYNMCSFVSGLPLGIMFVRLTGVIPFYGWVSIPLFQYLTLFLHFPVDSHLGCFQFGALVVSLLWTSSHKLFCGHRFLFILDGYLKVEWLGHVVRVCLRTDYFITRNCHTVSNVAVMVTLPWAALHRLTTTLCCWSLSFLLSFL